MPYPLRPAKPAAVKAKNALFMWVLPAPNRYDEEGERPDWRRPCRPVGLPDVAEPTLRFKRPQPPLVPLFASAPAKASQRSGAISVALPQNASAALEGGAENNAYDQITGRRARSAGR